MTDGVHVVFTVESSEEKCELRCATDSATELLGDLRDAQSVRHHHHHQ